MTSIIIEVHYIINSPLSVIGMPIYDESLLSSRWPVKMTFFVGLPPSVIPDEIIDQVKMVDFVGYAPNLFYGKRLRNQVVHDVIATKSSGHHFLGKQVPRFRSEQERAPKRSDSQTDSEDAILTAASFPSYYSKIEIQYSRFGIEDFDFGFYNKTGFGGLETNIPNSYCNSLIQCMFFTRILRSIVMWHLIDECKLSISRIILLIFRRAGILFMLRARVSFQNA
jgi:PAB-dependent poly(A)-specific ribonuclease subunit 2